MDKNSKNIKSALALSFLVSCAGILPHLWFSHIRNQWLYLINSYDEGFYGFSGLLIAGNVCERVASNIVLQLINKTVNSCSKTFFLCDLIFPAIICTISYSLFSLFFKTKRSITLATLCFIFSPEIFCNRSCLELDYLNIGKFIGKILGAIPGISAQIFINNNQTNTFWIFRTPEPQISQAITFSILFLSFKKWEVPIGQTTKKYFSIFKYLMFFVFPFCYNFVVLPFLPFILAGYIIFLRKKAVFVPELWFLVLGLVVKILFAVSSENHAQSFVFSSSAPSFTLSCIFSAIALLFIIIKSKKLAQIEKLAFVGFIIPILMCNQQVITGKMVMINNFENFSFPQLVFLSFALMIGSRKK